MTSPVLEACPDWEVAISLHAAEALENDQTEKLMAHVEGCNSCRSVLVASASALGLAQLPPLTEPERRVLSDLPARVLGDLRGRIGRRRFVFRISTLSAAAAAVLLAFASPVFLRKPPLDMTAGGARPMNAAVSQPEEVVAERDWQEPDLDELWDASDVLDLDSSQTRPTTVDAAVSSYEVSLGD